MMLKTLMILLATFLATSACAWETMDKKPVPVDQSKFKFTWEAPTTLVDGRPLTDLAGYYVNCGNAGVFGTFETTTTNSYEILRTDCDEVAIEAFRENRVKSEMSESLLVPPTDETPTEKVLGLQ